MSAKHDDGLAARMATLSKKRINELRADYTRATGKPANRLGRDALIKTLASAPAETPPAKQAKAPATPTRPTKAGRSNAGLAPGSTIEKTYKGKMIIVEVTKEGLRCAGKEWSSLTALALHITGYKAISGPAFFGLTRKAEKE